MSGNKRHLQDLPAAAFITLALIVLITVPFDTVSIPLCPFKAIFSTPCPLCGMTRALHEALLLKPMASIRFHPLGLPFLACLLTYYSITLARLSGLLSPNLQLLVSKIAEGKNLFAGISLLLFVIVWCLRLAGLSPV